MFNTTINAIYDDKGGIFFIYGYGGIRKAYIWRALTSALYFEGKIVLIVASSGIASILLPNGRTTYSRLVIPIDIHEDSTYNIKQGTLQAELLCKTDLIIWDETPMVNKLCFEALNKALRDILQLDNVGSEEMVFGGDF